MSNRRRRIIYVLPFKRSIPVKAPRRSKYSRASDTDTWLQDFEDNNNFLSNVDLDSFCSQMDPIRQFRLLRQFQESFQLTSRSTRGRSRSSTKNILRSADEWVQFSALIASAKLSRTGLESSFRLSADPTVDCLNFVDFTRKRSIYFSNRMDDLPIVIDSGATLSLTPNRNDFIGPLRPAPMSELNGLSHTTAVEGVGTVEWTIRDLFGTTRTIRTEAYYVPKATIRLFSPQAYFQESNAGQFLMTSRRSVLTLADGSKLEFPYNHGSNLPLMLPSVNQAIAGLTFEDQQNLT